MTVRMEAAGGWKGLDVMRERISATGHRCIGVQWRIDTIGFPACEPSIHKAWKGWNTIIIHSSTLDNGGYTTLTFNMKKMPGSGGR